MISLNIGGYRGIFVYQQLVIESWCTNNRLNYYPTSTTFTHTQAIIETYTCTIKVAITA